jgi:hypothetical protein
MPSASCKTRWILLPTVRRSYKLRIPTSGGHLRYSPPTLPLILKASHLSPPLMAGSGWLLLSKCTRYSITETSASSPTVLVLFSSPPMNISSLRKLPTFSELILWGWWIVRPHQEMSLAATLVKKLRLEGMKIPRMKVMAADDIQCSQSKRADFER